MTVNDDFPERDDSAISGASWSHANEKLDKHEAFYGNSLTKSTSPCDGNEKHQLYPRIFLRLPERRFTIVGGNRVSVGFLSSLRSRPIG